SALPYVDYLIVNEIEAGKVVGMTLHTAEGTDTAGCIDAARTLLLRGVRQQVVIHFTGGAVVADADGAITMQGSLNLPDGFIAGATGAGDAFAAGYLHGIHEAWSTSRRLQLGVCAAAACLTHPTPSGGLRPVPACLGLGERHGYRPIN
ncbi:MAG TPA: PfkB family carbohydrate kinase, partial [Verrucomicrobiaceae bacterium]